MHKFSDLMQNRNKWKPKYRKGWRYSKKLAQLKAFREFTLLENKLAV